MAKHITKGVIEDIAYQLKSSGLWIMAQKLQPEKITDSGIEINYGDPEEVLDDLIEQLSDVLAQHDPTFDRNKFNEQTSYKLFI